MSNQNNKQLYETIYGEAGLIYLRAPAKIETKDNGNTKEIVGSPFPKHAGVTKQPKYGPNAGDYYTLKMGTEFKPGRWAVLLDFDNKTEGTVRNGMEMVKTLNMDQYGAPKQLTPSKGCHYIFYLDDEQAKQMTSNSINNITYQGEQYAVDVKFKNQLCNCWPSKIPGYGEYGWVKGSFEKLKNIPQLPKELFELIKQPSKKSPATTPSTRTPASTPTRTPASTPTTSPPESPRAGSKQLQDFRSLCSCLSLAQLDNYDAWVRIGMILKSVGAPLSL